MQEGWKRETGQYFVILGEEKITSVAPTKNILNKLNSCIGPQFYMIANLLKTGCAIKHEKHFRDDFFQNA